MRVLHLLDTLEVAGTERHVITLAAAQRRLGAEAAVACRGGGRFAGEVAAAGLPAVVIDGRFIGPGGLLALRRAARGFDLLHAHNGRTSLTAALACGGRSVVATQHFITPGHAGRRGIGGLATTAAHRGVGGRIRRTIYVSRAALAAASSRGEPTDAARACVVPNGVDDPPSLTVAERAALRAETGAGPGDLLIACVARLEAEKGVADLIRALPQVLRRWPATRLAVWGEGSRRRELSELISALNLSGRAALRGFHPDAHRHAAAADLFALPSPAEPFGLVLLEAMAAALPVVACRSGGPLEIVEDGVTGLLVEPRSPAALAAALIDLAADPTRRLRMGEAGRRRFETLFTADRMAARTLAAYAG